jgi:hypothetical protein
MIIGFDKRIPKGYAVYRQNYSRLAYHVCLWCFYPIFKLATFIIEIKYNIYDLLNKKGIMHTPEACKMTLTDLFKKSEKPYKYENVIAGYFKYDNEEGD